MSKKLAKEIDNEMKIKYLVFLNRYHQLDCALKEANIRQELLTDFLISIDDLLINGNAKKNIAI